MSAFLSSTIARKVVMALSGLFLILFLAQHFTINFTSVIAPATFNQWSHFMGYNPFVQFLLQPILMAGVLIHFVMGIYLEIRNHRARTVKYVKFSGGANSSWASRNMIVTGLVVLAFLGLHIYDFWVHEMAFKYVVANPQDPTRYYAETVEKFEPVWRTVIYVVAFILLAVHLWHGFASSIQTMGWNDKYNPLVKKISHIYAVVIPMGFILIALYHHFNPITH